MTRSGIRTIISVFTAAALLSAVACGSSTTTGDSQSTSQVSAPSESEGTSAVESGSQSSSSAEVTTNAPPDASNTLVVAINDEPTTLNVLVSSAPNIQTIANSWVEGLWHLDGQFKPVPGLATSWDFENDDHDLIVHLREGVTWQDGQPFTSDDVVFTLTELAKLSARAGSFLDALASVEAVDPLTVKISMKNIYGPIMTVLDARILPILPKHLLGEGDVATNEYNKMPIGTGPFKVVEWNHGESVTVDANENYWGPAPEIRRVVFKITPDVAAMTNAMQSGEIDVIGNAILNGNAAKTLEGSDVTIKKLPGTPVVKYLLPNTKNPILSDPAVRKAVFTAINRDAIIESAFTGYATPASGMIPNEYTTLWVPENDYNVTFAYSPENAAKMFDDAGYPEKDGVRFEIGLSYGSASQGAESVARLIQANLKEVGVIVKLESLDLPTFMDKVYKQNDFDMAHIGSSTYGDPNLGIDRTYVCDDSGKAYQNPTGYCNPELDATLKSAASSVDDVVRQGFYAQAQEIITRDMPVMALCNVPKYEAYTSRLQNMDTELDYFGAGDPTWNFASLN